MSDENDMQAITVEQIADAMESLKGFLRGAQIQWVRFRGASGLTERIASYVLFVAMARALDPTEFLGDLKSAEEIQRLIDETKIIVGPPPEGTSVRN